MRPGRNLAAWAFGGALAAFVGGFLVFGAQISGEEPQLKQNADGMVVLTGGAERLSDAFRLLQEGRARRLLVTGVGPATSATEIARNVAGSAPVLDCCVDLGYAAQNTAGNALEAEQWARAHDLGRSLIVVTSAYHMPRAMVEMRHRLPGSDLFAYPVVPERLRGKHWWNDSVLFRLAVSEYVEYLSARARILAGGFAAS